MSETRDMAVAKAFFRGALEVAREALERVTTDGHDSCPRAIREELGVTVLHRTNRYLNNWIEKDHRGIKQRCVDSARSNRPSGSACRSTR